MTYSNDHGETATMPVDAASAAFHASNSDGENTTVNSKNRLFRFDSVSDIATVGYLNAIDMTNANNNVSQDIYSGNTMFSNFQKLSMNEPPRNHDASKKSEDVPRLNFACEATKETKTSTTVPTAVHESAKDLRLFLGDEDGDTPLHVCIMQEDEANSIHIINRAPDFTYLSVQNNLLQTPLHLAARMNSTRTVRKLICAGADIQCQDRDGNTALHIACSHGYLEIVKQLLKPVMYRETLENKYPIPYIPIPQNMNVKNYDGLTCLHLAVLCQNVDILRLLLEVAADPNIGDSKSGRTPIHVAAEHGLLDCVSLLISYRTIELDVTNYAGHTPALLAYSRGHVKVAQLLVRYGASHGFYHCCNEHDNASSDEENSMDI